MATRVTNAIAMTLPSVFLALGTINTAQSARGIEPVSTRPDDLLERRMPAPLVIEHFEVIEQLHLPRNAQRPIDWA